MDQEWMSLTGTAEVTGQARRRNGSDRSVRSVRPNAAAYLREFRDFLVRSVSGAPRRRRHDAAWNLRIRLVLSIIVTGIVTSALALAQAPTTTVPPPENTKKEQVKVGRKPALKQDVGIDAGFQDAISKRPAARDPANTVPDRELAAARKRQNVIERYATMGRPIVRAELIFVRHICPMGQEKFRQISRDADDALQDVASQMFDSQLQRSTIAGRRKSAAIPDSGKLLRDGLTEVMKKHLSPEEWPLYQVELERRRASRKRLAVRYLVDALDRDLYLSDQQRATLTESLSSFWDDGWEIYLEYVLHGNQFYPMTMEPVLLPILSDVQKKVWQSSQKVQLSPPFGGFLGGFVQDHDALEQEIGEVKKAGPPDAAGSSR
jgi:hypothetical protein